MPPGDQYPITETTMDIDIDMDLGPEPEFEPEPEPIQTVSIATGCTSTIDCLHETNANTFSLIRMQPHKKALSTLSPRKLCSKRFMFVAWMN